MIARRRIAWPALSLAFVVACVDAESGPATGFEPSFALGGVGRPSVLVNPDADDNGTAKTIQEGIDMVAEGGKVMVLPGTYTEALVIDKGLTLEGLESVTVGAPGVPVATIAITTPDPVVIRSLTVLKPGSNGIFGNGKVDVTLEHLKIVSVGTGPGTNRLVRMFNNAGQTGGRARLVVRESDLDGAGVPGVNGVSLQADIDAVIERNRIRRTTSICIFVESFGPAGITADILNNVLDECDGRTAIDVGPTPTQVINFGTTGVVNIIGNTIRNSTGLCLPTTAIHYQLYTGRIERNTIIGFLQECAAPITDALPSAIWVGSLRGFPPASPVVRFNDIEGNAHAGLRLAPNITAEIDARCNWWGAANGPSGFGPGSGDAVVVEAGGVAPGFMPFAVAPIAGTGATGC